MRTSGIQAEADPLQLAKLRKAQEMRQQLYNQMYPLPYYCTAFAWILLVLMSLTAFGVSVLFGMKFDLSLAAEDNTENVNYGLYQSDCWNTSLQLRIENALSLDDFNEQYAAQEDANGSSYGGSDSASWLLSLGQSLLLSLLLWQPLTIAFITWIKIWMFTWHLELKFPNNVFALCKRCCCGHDHDADDNVIHEDGAMNQNGLDALRTKSVGHVAAIPSLSEFDTDALSSVLPSSKITFKNKKSSHYSTAIASTKRPKDRLSFLSDDTLFVEETQDQVEMGIMATTLSAPIGTCFTENHSETTRTVDGEPGNIHRPRFQTTGVVMI